MQTVKIKDPRIEALQQEIMTNHELWTVVSNSKINFLAVFDKLMNNNIPGIYVKIVGHKLYTGVIVYKENSNDKEFIQIKEFWPTNNNDAWNHAIKKLKLYFLEVLRDKCDD